ncbi:MAG TPA: beta-aspartyl-peptidase [Clostridia bacterium]|nr:beta-aspartyl-peptidase [Clostridia bacterium]
MLTLLNRIECYAPEYIGTNDILIANEKIEKIMPPDSQNWPKEVNTIPCDGLLAFPGLIDQHVHIIGGGGEQGVSSRIAEINSSEIFMAGITTLVGVLGLDRYTKSLESLLAKTKALESEGLTALMYTGSYSVPAVTLTGSIARDLVLIDAIIGVGEIAISDQRSSQPEFRDLAQLASQAFTGGMVGGKAGIVHIHVGDGKSGLGPLTELLSRSDFSRDQFIPTHVNRNHPLFCQAVQYCRNGGQIDLTAGETAGISVSDAVCRLLAELGSLSGVTVSSDANGSIPGGGVGKIGILFEDLRECIVGRGLSPETILPLVTRNVAKVLKLYPRKGVIREGSDADILITSRDFRVRKLFCKGILKVDQGRPFTDG